MCDAVTKEIREALDATGLAWAIENGRKHSKLRLDGRLIAVMSRSNPSSRSRNRDSRNIVSQIRRAAKEQNT